MVTYCNWKITKANEGHDSCDQYLGGNMMSLLFIGVRKNMRSFPISKHFNEIQYQRKMNIVYDKHLIVGNSGGFKDFGNS